MLFDLGHGSDSFNFHVAEVAFEQKMLVSTVSTDIYYRNRKTGPVHDLATTIEKLLEIGYPLESLIAKVTCEQAKNFHLTNKGLIVEGYDADFTIFKTVNQPKELTDSNGNKRIGKTQIVPQKAIVGGKIFKTVSN